MPTQPCLWALWCGQSLSKGSLLLDDPILVKLTRTNQHKDVWYHFILVNSRKRYDLMQGPGTRGLQEMKNPIYPWLHPGGTRRTWGKLHSLAFSRISGVINASVVSMLAILKVKCHHQVTPETYLGLKRSGESTPTVSFRSSQGYTVFCLALKLEGDPSQMKFSFWIFFS